MNGNISDAYGENIKNDNFHDIIKSSDLSGKNNNLKIKESIQRKKFLTEKDFEDLCLDMHKDNINSFIAEEKMLLQKYPQNDVLEDYYNDYEEYRNIYKNVCCNNLLFSFYFTIRYLMTNYGYVSYVIFFRNYLKIYCATTPFFLAAAYVIYPRVGPYSNNGMEYMSKNELYVKRLIEKVDIYDSVDAILNLKDRYSLYELNQMKKEEYRINESIVSQNMSNFVSLTTKDLNSNTNVNSNKKVMKNTNLDH